ncbi:SusC/RagA family TonB-linked outer membrane protein [Flagellimonas halotolerans]|uniref:SusC/RagA family TonB-linked outer membrane protein n=1 Tax=Flagellimonas halotolerans TaxID=3112164 RepID=A0ABU6IPW0_9FLAO|nr:MULTISPECIES: SusC/RagA family TonB-linked outer membrane protein [unclassified Allomuricauda]MEC3965291.1 SusC/RagA family TonB-linked outer membrane protein [Muricauda sp. SYSU M86414]MEC4265157.1 SusC/RagA family TonB-linked outer membrane protein [Muricauda sp. SYSU M84420]
MKNSILTFLIAFTVSIMGYSQVAFTGQVVDENNIPLPGASVVVKGKSIGAATDFDGNFEIELPQGGETLVISYIGYIPKELVTVGKTSATVVLQPDSQQLDEVVVTALGIEREKKSLGYASQELDNDDVVKAREPNLLNSMSGKVAGLQITNSPSGLGGSARVSIRGDASLNINGNSPLFVVDGTPISNEIVGSSGSGTQSVDYGNGAAEINPQDIESINVLKGPAAAALYGARAANGAIIITTKKGRSQGSKLGVSFNTGVTIDNVLMLPDWQNEYGQGNNQQFAFVDGSGSGIADGVDESWGPRLDTGLLIPQFDSPRADGTRGGDTFVSNAPISPTPWVSNPDNTKDFFETGITKTNSIAISKSGEMGNMRLSFQNLDQEGTLPNTDLERNSLNFSGSLNVSEKVKVNANINYVKTDSDNRPAVGYGTESIMYLFIWYGRQLNTNNLRDYWQPGLEGIQQFNYNYNYHDNPYFTMYENTNAQDKDRIFGNISLTYDITDNWKLLLRSGRDFYRDFRERKRAFSTQRFPFGTYQEDNIFFEESNTDFLLSYDKTFNEKWNVNISGGGNILRQKQDFTKSVAPQLINPGVYSFNNSRQAVQVSSNNYEKRINSLYGYARFAYDSKIFLDLTGRNDWSSTLPSDNNSYFYPSATLSAIASDIFKMPEWVTFAKVRAAYAEVGNDTDPYRLRSFYQNERPFDGSTPILTESSLIPNADLKPEITSSYEFGLDLRFFQSRMNFDLTYYDSSTKNQIINISTDIASGYSSQLINAGEVRNYGFEAIASFVPVLSDNFKWTSTFNFSTNQSEVKDLGGVNFTLTSANGAFIQAREGGSISAIYGRGFQRVEDPNSEFFGQKIVNNQGIPIRTDDLVYQGDYAPDFTLGFQNSFRYKNVDFGFLLDTRQGGIVVSRTKTIGSTSGQLMETLEGRETGIVAEGVVNTGTSENPVYVPNTTNVDARTYNNRYYERDNVEAAKYDASYTKLREVTLGYSFPKRIIDKLPISNARFSLTGRNLLLWTDNPHFDPEVVGVSGGTLQPGIENMSYPSTRSFTFNLQVNF